MMIEQRWRVTNLAAITAVSNCYRVINAIIVWLINYILQRGWSRLVLSGDNTTEAPRRPARARSRTISVVGLIIINRVGQFNMITNSLGHNNVGPVINCCNLCTFTDPRTTTKTPTWTFGVTGQNMNTPAPETQTPSLQVKIKWEMSWPVLNSCYVYTVTTTCELALRPSLTTASRNFKTTILKTYD